MPNKTAVFFLKMCEVEKAQVFILLTQILTVVQHIFLQNAEKKCIHLERRLMEEILYVPLCKSESSNRPVSKTAFHSNLCCQRRMIPDHWYHALKLSEVLTRGESW